jgi:hypothetical protein
MPGIKEKRFNKKNNDDLALVSYSILEYINSIAHSIIALDETSTREVSTLAATTRVCVCEYAC